MLGNMPNVSSLLNQSFGNGGPNPQLSGTGSTQRRGIDSGAESDPLSTVGNGVGFNTSSSSFVPSNTANPDSSGQVQGQQFSNLSGNRLLLEQQQSQQFDSQHFQHGQEAMQQFTAPYSTQQGQQQQFQSVRAGLAGVGAVKLEPQVTDDQHVQQQQQLQSLRNLAPVKLEPRQIPPTRTVTQIKMEPQHSDHLLFLHQQQQQQLLQMSRQPSQAAAQINLLHQQRLLQLHQQQHQQQLLKAMPQQRSQLSQQFQQQNLPLRSPVKPVYEPGMCARRLMHYMYQQQHRPKDNNIDFWRKFVAEYFAPNARKKWCVSMYGNVRQTAGVFPQDVWHCEICNRKPGHGFEATVEVLPRLFKIKYESGTLEELLYVDMPHEYQNSCGQIVLDYAKAIQESVFEQLRVVRDGQLRIIFSPDLKICYWEFCARRHEELIPRKLLISQISQLGAAAQKCQAATQNASTNLSASELQNNCNLFVASARQLAKTLEVPLVNDLGYTKRYVRCLQISEVVNSMKDLIDYCTETKTGPMESLAKFPRRTSTSSGFHAQAQQPEEKQQQQHQHQQTQQQQMMDQSSNSDQSSAQASQMQLAASSGVANINCSLNAASPLTSTGSIVGTSHQNSINSRQKNSMHNATSPYVGHSVQIPSVGSSSTIPQAQANPSPFQSPTPSFNNPPQAPHDALAASSQMSSANSSVSMPVQQPALSGEADPTESQNSVQKIIHEIMSSQLNATCGMVEGGTIGNDVKSVNGMLPTSNNTVLNGGDSLVGSGTVNNNSGIGGGAGGFGSMGGGFGQSAIVNGIIAAMRNNPVMSGSVGMTPMAQDKGVNLKQQDLGNRLLGGLGAINSVNNLQFDWKPSP